MFQYSLTHYFPLELHYFTATIACFRRHERTILPLKVLEKNDIFIYDRYAL